MMTSAPVYLNPDFVCALNTAGPVVAVACLVFMQRTVVAMWRRRLGVKS